mmetsp:Transcript_9193/g.18414  ORF Transcript_9193/g.18414 Transcript_9193/m.18414 type:complete len:364 (+) Transcript_9193:74-1165(+)
MANYGPTWADAAARNYSCADLSLKENSDWQNNCPVMSSCFYDEAYGDVDNVPSCHCGTIAITSQEDFPACQTLSDKSWLPITVGIVNVMMTFTLVCYSVWIIFILKKLKQFQMNDIMQCLILAIAGTSCILIHQSAELAQMFLLDRAFHEAIYRNGGLLQICLAGLGGCAVLSSLKIPLLWMAIASSGMNKADAAKNKAKVAKVLKVTSTFFLITFVAIMAVSGTTNGGTYSLLWMLILIAAFQIGSRKLRRQLVKPGEELPPAVRTMRYFVRRWCVVVFLYIVSIVLFIVNSPTENSNPENWSLWAGLIYHLLAQLFICNIMYIRKTLEKKLAKFKKTGQVTPSTTITSSSSASERSETEGK